MDPLNQNCFAQPHWRLDAQGFRTKTWYEAGRAVQSGGIFNPQIINLKVGQRHYRFADSTKSRESQLGGYWWVDYENFRTIERYSNANAVSLRDAARLFLALPIDWTRVDRLVSAILMVPLRAYCGRGKVASVPGTEWPQSKPLPEPTEKWTPMQHIHVMQLYIPGLRGPDSTPQLFESAFPDPQIEYVASRKKI